MITGCLLLTKGAPVPEGWEAHESDEGILVVAENAPDINLDDLESHIINGTISLTKTEVEAPVE